MMSSWAFLFFEALLLVAAEKGPLYIDTGSDLFWTTGGRANRGFITSSSLTFIPAKRCTPTEIVIKFTADFNISSGDKIAVELAGFTTGKCDNTEGKSITATVDEIESDISVTPGSLKLYPDSHFLGGYREGQVQKGYQDSRLVFTVRKCRSQPWVLALHGGISLQCVYRCGLEHTTATVLR